MDTTQTEIELVETEENQFVFDQPVLDQFIKPHSMKHITYFADILTDIKLGIISYMIQRNQNISLKQKAEEQSAKHRVVVRSIKPYFALFNIDQILEVNKKMYRPASIGRYNRYGDPIHTNHGVVRNILGIKQAPKPNAKASID
jgi:hypothetical protein